MEIRARPAGDMGSDAQRHGEALTTSDFESLAEFRYRLRKFLRFSEEATQALGLTPLQYQLLLQVKGYPGRAHPTVGQLAERLQSKHHGVVALLSRCEELGLVQRRPCTHDLRQVQVHLTAKGESIVRRLAALHTHELAGSGGALAALRLLGPLRPEEDK